MTLFGRVWLVVRVSRHELRQLAEPRLECGDGGELRHVHPEHAGLEHLQHVPRHTRRHVTPRDACHTWGTRQQSAMVRLSPTLQLPATRASSASSAVKPFVIQLRAHSSRALWSAKSPVCAAF